MPVVDVVIGSLFLEHDIRVALVELSVELRVLLNRLELLNSVDLHGVLTRLGEEGFSLGTQLADVFLKVGSVERPIVVCFNHFVRVV